MKEQKINNEPLEEKKAAHHIVKRPKKIDFDSLLTPSSIYNLLDKSVVGQDKAKRDLSISAYNHIKRNSNQGKHIGRSNILMVGPSGSGKTLICETLSKSLDVPYVIADATTFTEAGYIGEDVDSIITNLIIKARGNIKAAEKGIVFIDEIDKISQHSGKSSVNSKGVQRALLKMIEGADIMVSDSHGENKRKNILFDTRNVLFICGGAFEGIDQIISKRISNKSIGLTANIQAKTNYQELMSNISTVDFEQYGLIREFLGRIPVWTFLDPLDLEKMEDILVKPKNSIVKQYKELLSIDGINLEFEDKAIRMIAKKSIQNKTGARGHRKIIEEVLSDVMFEARALNGKTVLITEGCYH